MSARVAYIGLLLLSLLLQVAVVGGIVHVLRGRYQFPLWRQAWAALLVAACGMVLRRLWDLTANDSVLLAFVSIVISSSMLLWLWRLVQIYDLPLTLRNPTIPARIVVDQFSVILEWDREAERLFGWLASEAVGKTLMQTVMPPQDWEAHRRGMTRVLALDVPTPIERTFPGLTAVRKDGSFVPIELSISGRYVPSRGWEFHAAIRRLILL